jgi:hypothetical protein
MLAAVKVPVVWVKIPVPFIVSAPTTLRLLLIETRLPDVTVIAFAFMAVVIVFAAVLTVTVPRFCVPPFESVRFPADPPTPPKVRLWPLFVYTPVAAITKFRFTTNASCGVSVTPPLIVRSKNI